MSVFDTIVTDAVEVDVTVSLYTIPNPVMARTPFRFVALFGNSTSLEPKDRLSCSIDAPGAGIQFFQPYIDVPITNNTFTWDAIITTCNVRLFDAAINCNITSEKGEEREAPVSVSAIRVSSGSKIEPRLELHGVDDVEARLTLESTHYSVPAVGVSCSLKWTESFLPPPTSASISTTWSDDGIDIVSTADNVPCASTADNKAATCPLGDFIGHTTRNLTAVFHAPSSTLAGKSATLQVSCADVANCNVRNGLLLRLT